MKTPQWADFTGQDIYTGIDVHLRTWKVSVFSGHGEFKTFSQAADADRLTSYLQRTFRGARLHVAYEAGFSGFWLAHRLQAAGIAVCVVNPADVPTRDSERRYKRDRSDARKLARLLRAGQLEPIYVPSVEQLADRALVRTRYQLVAKQTRVKNQVKSHLHFFGVPIPEDFARRSWSAAFLSYLETLPVHAPALAHSGAAETLALQLAELRQLRVLLLENMRAIRRLSRTKRYAQDVEHLVALPGIGLLTAMILMTEIIDVERFAHLDQLAAFAGLAPSLGGSGDAEYEGPITPRRSKHLRRILVESAWVAVRKDLALMADFDRLSRRMPRNNAIIRIARKQLARVRFVLKNHAPCAA
jgi:transposase